MTLHANGQIANVRPACPVRPAMDGLVLAALEDAPVGLIVLDLDRTVRLLTSKAGRLLGLDGYGSLEGLPISMALAECPSLDSIAARRLVAGLEDAALEPQEVRLDVSGSVLSVDIRAAGGCGWVMSLNDVTHSRQTEDWLLEHVSSDPVTGLWNRQHFMLMFQEGLMASAESDAAPPCMVLVGLGNFTQAKAALGPAVIDALLRQVGERVARMLSGEDMLARFGPGEFAVALTRPVGRDDVAARCRRMLEVLATPFQVEGHRVSLDVQVGVALAPQDGATPHDLATHAGLALQAAAADQVAEPRFFHPSLSERAHSRRALETDLRHALEHGEFELHYQPQVDVFCCKVTGLEALIRWRNPQRGLVSPALFVTVAEEIGLISDIGDWVLHEACREAVRWPDDVTIAVNASPLQFETGRFARSVAHALATTGLPARRLEVEITENLLLRDTGLVHDTLAALEELGVRLVLDDFGTGYASLSQLSRFRFDKIKIDRSFVSPADVSAQNSAIVRSIAALGASLGIPTTAEGVETATQLAQIKADGCTCVQGYYFSRPVPSDDVGAMMTRLNQA